MSNPRTVVVTGASAGVGRAIATLFGSEGWQVGLIARGREGLESARAEIEDAGGRALAIEADVSDAEALMTAASRIERELGPVDVWVNNAMVTIYATSVDVTPAEFEQVTRITYLGQVFGAQAALKHMRARDRGKIIFIGSALAYRSIPFQAPYCAAKAAVRGFVDSLRSELMWEGSHVRLTMVHLPAVNTPQFDWARNKFDRKLAPVPPNLSARDRGGRRAPRGSRDPARVLARILGRKGDRRTDDRALRGRSLSGKRWQGQRNDGRTGGREEARQSFRARPWQPWRPRTL